MCGITGIVSQNPGYDINKIIMAMTETLTHRGPDGTGTFIEGTIALGHCRLSIIDLSTGGQPMYSIDKRYTIVFNGEIYNYIELREELQKEGFSFLTHSDTEVLLNAYIKWGTACLDRFIGMFAFAIWDSLEQTLFCARDRLGKKPFLYFWDNTTFAFASELKAFMHIPGFESRLNSEAVDLYFALGYIPAPDTIFKKINKLPAGHFLQFKENNISVQRYWHPENVLYKPTYNINSLKEEFNYLFSESIRIRLRSDVPVGIFLSGGVDSSAIAYEIAKQGNQNITALTASFDFDKTDLPFAIDVGKNLGIPVNIIIIGSNISNDFEQICKCYDEPFSDTANIPAFYISREASKYCKVIISGDGGDEIFGGYTHYEYADIKHWIKRIGCLFKIKEGKYNNFYQVYLQSKALFSQKERVKLLGSHSDFNAFSKFIDMHAYLSAVCERNILKKVMIADRHIQLPDAYLYKIDIAMGAFGIEGRCPFLDHRLVEWASKLSTSLLVKGQNKKVFLRGALRNILPEVILSRPKMGFGSPIVKWLQDPLYDLVSEYLPCPLFEKSMQQSLLKKFYNGSLNEARRVWLLLAFSVWARQYKAYW